MADSNANKATDNATNNEETKSVVLTKEYYDPKGVEYDSAFNWTLDEDWRYDRHWGFHFPSHFKLTLNERFSLSDKSIFRSRKVINEKLKVVPNIRKDNSYLFKTHLRIQDEKKNTTVIYRKFNERTHFTDHLKYDGQKALFDSFHIFDTILRPANGVISDIIVEEGDWTIENLNQYIFKGKPAGYGFFKPFVFGEYNYESALFRTSLDATNNDSLYIENFNYSVDVPDIVDRGSGEVVDKNFDLVVKFNKHFHTAPEVTVSVRSGTSGNTIVPTIVEITKSNFKVNLRKATDDSRTVGRFIWTAIGY